MSKGQTLRDLVIERLAAATDEIFELFEKTIAEFEEQLYRSKEENKKKQQLLDLVLSPKIHVVRADFHVSSPNPGTCVMEKIPQITTLTDDGEEEEDQLSVLALEPTAVCSNKEESSAPYQKPTEPRKEAQKGDIISEADCVKQTEHSSDAEELEPPLTSAIARSETPIDGAHCKQVQIKGNEPASQTGALNTGAMLGTERGARCKKHKRKNKSKNTEGAERKKHQCLVCGKTYRFKLDLRVHSRVHTKEKRFKFSPRKKTFSKMIDSDSHSKANSKDNFRRSMCNKTISPRNNLLHQRQHTEAKPHSYLMCRQALYYKSPTEVQEGKSSRCTDCGKKHCNCL